MTSKGGWFRMFVDSATTEQGSTTNQPAVPSEAQSSSAFLRLMMVYSRRGLSLAAWLLLLVAFWLVVRSSSSSTASTTASSPPAASVTPREAADLRDEVKEMFYHGFDNYMDYAFPLDELRPMSCTGEDSLGGYALTLVDSLDMLALLGDRTRFSRGVNWLGKNLHFDKNKTVSVFETTIRVLGGLLSAHLIASDASTGMHVDHYDNELLRLAEDLGRRMLPAFDTPTGIPYGSVNLALGVSDDESQVSSTAGGGTLTLEFGVLSRLTGDPEFEKVTKRAVQGLWAQRSRLNLVGGHINVFTSEWTHKDAGIGTSIDSFYEYLLKAYLLLGDEEYLFIFKEAYKSVMRHLHNDPWYLEVNMNSGVVVWPLFNSLQAFWPGLQVLAGDVEPAIRTHKAFYAVWKRYGFTPEGFNLATSSVQPGQRSYPLRPELVESTYMLYKATRNPTYLDVGRDIVASLQKYAKCRCGYCHIADVESHEQDDHMESFFLSETVKYLWLLFDLAAGGDNLVEKGPHPYIFNTEGHFLPMSPEISLPSELCNESGSSCRERIVERLVDAKSQLMIEIEESRKAEEESSTGSCNVDSESGSQTCSITQHDGENRGTDGISPAESSQTGMCPKPNLWRQLGLTLAHQSPALTRAKPKTTPVKPLEGNLISVGRMAQAGSAFEKHARELLTQILKGSRSIVGDNGNALASFQVIRDAETGEITLQGDDEETGAVITLGGLDEAKSLLAGFNEEAGATVTLRGVDEAEPLRAGNNEEAGATVTLRGVDEAEPLRAGNNEEAGALVTLQGLDEEKPSSRAGDNEEVTVQEDNARDEGIQRQSAFVVEDTVHR